MRGSNESFFVAGFEPRQDLPRYDQSGYLSLRQTWPKMKDTIHADLAQDEKSWVYHGLLYMFRSSAYILHRLLWLLRTRCNDLHLHVGVHMGTVRVRARVGDRTADQLPKYERPVSDHLHGLGCLCASVLSEFQQHTLSFPAHHP